MSTRLPPFAAWRHRGAADGFEVLFPHQTAEGLRFEGHATAVEEGVARSVHYVIELDARWVTRRARVESLSVAGERAVELAADGAGAWSVDGRPEPRLDGLLDLDLEASAFTNAFPVKRLALEIGDCVAAAPAVYVRAPGCEVERLEQTYERIEDEGARTRYDYASPADGFAAVIAYDADGLVAHYPGIAERAA